MNKRENRKDRADSAGTKAKTSTSLDTRIVPGCYPVRKAFMGLIRFYQKYISPLLPPSCRYTPTCSQYALEAVERFGAFKGTGLAIWRVLRCNPFSKGGYDPVPQKKRKE